MSVQQALIFQEAFSSDNHVAFTSELHVHEDSGTNGTNPSSGNDLLCVVYGQTASSIDNVDATDGASNVTTGTLQYAMGDNTEVWLIPNIGSGVTSVRVQTGSSAAWVLWVLECDQALTENTSARTTFGVDGDGFVTTHDFDYTTDVANELVICYMRSTSGTKDWGAGSGTTIVSEDTTSSVCIGYKEVALAESGTIDWTFDAAGNCSAALTAFEQASGTSLPVFQNFYRQQD